MQRLCFIVSLLLMPWCGLKAQSFTDSNLPIVIINTDGNATIPDQPRILATMKVIYSGEGVRNYVADQNNPAVLNYNGRIEIEIRGSSSQFLNKKQYGLTTLMADNISNNNVSLLGMPKENDWVLNGLAFDPSLMRDYLSYTLSRRIGQYAPRTQYCEVVINGNYRGLYLLQEKIKADDNRVDISKIEPGDNILPDLSGGYITKADKVTSEDPSSFTMSTYTGGSVNFIHEFPKPSVISVEQHNYIRSRFEKLGATAANVSVTDGFPSVIDIPSFVDFMIINELAANVDAYQFSTFFHKDKNGKLRAGPIWDLNLTYGNDLFLWGFNRSKTNLWQFDNGDNVGPRFWKDLFNNTTFRCYLSRRWNQLTQPGAPLHLSSLVALIDETVATIGEAATREQTKWLSEKSAWQTELELSAQIAGIKNFLQARILWMTNSLGSFSACQTIATPPLVITRIHYHPATTSAFTDSNDQEFIEITNYGNTSVSLTGFYFSGTGFGYQFPAGYSLSPQGVLQLANHRETFRDFHGFYPAGEFARNLSNTRQKLTLADAFGNVIDEVEYSDEAPWPDAGGTMNHIKLIDPSLDNNIGSNWIATDESITTTIVATEGPEEQDIQIFPNPIASDKIEIKAPKILESVSLYNLYGQRMGQSYPETTSTVVELKNFAAGIYYVCITTSGKTVVKKIVKR